MCIKLFDESCWAIDGHNCACLFMFVFPFMDVGIDQEKNNLWFPYCIWNSFEFPVKC